MELSLAADFTPGKVRAFTKSCIGEFKPIAEFGLFEICIFTKTGFAEIRVMAKSGHAEIGFMPELRSPEGDAAAEIQLLKVNAFTKPGQGKSGCFFVSGSVGSRRFSFTTLEKIPRLKTLPGP
ncbi:MAG: hypothetical protein PVG03_06440 [Desulfarculaceae bacterium]